MDQNGSQPKSISEMLAEFADQERERDRVEADAKRLGHPVKPVAVAIPEEKPVIQKAVSYQVSPTFNEDEILLTSAEGARLLGYTEKSFRNAVAAGKIPHYKLLGQNRFKKSELLGLLIRIETK